MNILAILCGGAVGGMLRYLLAPSLPVIHPSTYPNQVMVVNLLGSCLLGIFAELSDTISLKPWLLQGISTGIIGGFTTFSSFSVALIALSRSHPAWILIVYGIGSMILSLICVAVSSTLTRLFLRGVRRVRDKGPAS